MKIRQEGNTAVAYYSAEHEIYQVLEDKIVLKEQPEKGRASFKKKIAVNNVDNVDTSLYSMEGTEYAICYKSSGSLALTIVFGKDGKYKDVRYPDGINVQAVGNNGVLDLPAGEYTAKEIHSGSGLYLDTSEKEFTVKENETAEFE